MPCMALGSYVSVYPADLKIPLGHTLLMIPNPQCSAQSLLRGRGSPNSHGICSPNALSVSAEEVSF